jgi:hypothetical protein
MVTAIRKSAGRRIVRAIITTPQHHKSFGGSCPYRQTANNRRLQSANERAPDFRRLTTVKAGGMLRVWPIARERSRAIVDST